MTRETTTTTTARTIGRISDDAGTAYTAIVETVDPDEHPGLEQAGYHSETTLYTVATSGAVHTDYDPHRLAREKLPGNAGWVIDALHDLEQEHEEIVDDDVRDDLERIDDAIEALEEGDR